MQQRVAEGPNVVAEAYKDRAADHLPTKETQPQGIAQRYDNAHREYGDEGRKKEVSSGRGARLGT
jgi:hypothetical protein